MPAEDLKPLFPAFNEMVQIAVHTLLPQGFDITTDPELCYPFERIKRHYLLTERIRVWTGASEHTIFGDPPTNYAFRAWHDSVHILYDLPFTTEGEHHVMLIQQNHCATLGRSRFNDRELILFYRILECEIDG